MKQKKQLMFVVILALISISVMTSCSKSDGSEKQPVEKSATIINFSFATRAEGQQLMRGNTEHYADMSQNDIDWRMRKENATIDELKAFAQEQVLDFSDDEKTLISKAVHTVEDSLKAIGCHLPIFDHIVFIKTTMKEEGNPWAYTIKNEIFIGEEQTKYYVEKKDSQEEFQFFTRVIAHELFHCISRNSAEFRQKMYNLIGFTVLDHDIVFPENIKSLILQNPDVEHIDNYAEFTINGKKRNCALIAIYSETWSEAYAKSGEQATFFNSNETVLVPLDDLGTKYKTSDVPDFWDKVGRNTTYVLAPEECMADNFSFAVAYGMTQNYQSPEIIVNLINTLKTFK